MNGRIMPKKGNLDLTRGPYTLDYCKILLKKLLQAQKSVRENGPNANFSLILPQELFEIRRIWQTQRSDWEDSVALIYKEVVGENMSDQGVIGIFFPT